MVSLFLGLVIRIYGLKCWRRGSDLRMCVVDLSILRVVSLVHECGVLDACSWGFRGTKVGNAVGNRFKVWEILVCLLLISGYGLEFRVFGWVCVDRGW